MILSPSHILEAALYVGNIAKARDFYVGVLGFTVLKETPGRNRDLFLKCGETTLILFNPAETIKETGIVPPHGAVGPGHMAFAIDDADFPLWRQKFAKHDIAIEREIDWDWGTHSLYFRDSSGNSLELVSKDHWQKFLQKSGA